MLGKTSFSERSEMLLLLHQATTGGKFDDKVPNLQAAFGKVNRSNVLSAVEKLTKTYGVTWQEDYQWLCKVGHHSVGNYFAFSSPAFRRDSGTHLHVWFAGAPLEAISSAGEVRRVGIIESALTRSGVRSARALLADADDALRGLDDVALTTRAAEIATFGYWRNVAVRRHPGPRARADRGSGRTGAVSISSATPVRLLAACPRTSRREP